MRLTVPIVTSGKSLRATIQIAIIAPKDQISHSMNEPNNEKIKQICPRLFERGVFCACGDGWYDIVEEAVCDLSRASIGSDLIINDIKEKYGSLRIYTSFTTDRIDEIVDHAEAKSLITCEDCGKPGEMQPGYWRMVRCKDCAESHL